MKFNKQRWQHNFCMDITQCTWGQYTCDCCNITAIYFYIKYRVCYYMSLNIMWVKLKLSIHSQGDQTTATWKPLENLKPLLSMHQNVSHQIERINKSNMHSCSMLFTAVQAWPTTTHHYNWIPLETRNQNYSWLWATVGIHIEIFQPRRNTYPMFCFGCWDIYTKTGLPVV